jgi:hypothetical protein
LLDERYREPFYQQMIPAFYGTPVSITSPTQCTQVIEEFWAKKKHV